MDTFVQWEMLKMFIGWMCVCIIACVMNGRRVVLRYVGDEWESACAWTWILNETNKA